jgi:hypothetical protein
VIVEEGNLEFFRTQKSILKDPESSVTATEHSTEYLCFKKINYIQISILSGANVVLYITCKYHSNMTSVQYVGLLFV